MDCGACKKVSGTQYKADIVGIAADGIYDDTSAHPLDGYVYFKDEKTKKVGYGKNATPGVDKKITPAAYNNGVNAMLNPVTSTGSSYLFQEKNTICNITETKETLSFTSTPPWPVHSWSAP